jgi:hypothetical protein
MVIALTASPASARQFEGPPGASPQEAETSLPEPTIDSVLEAYREGKPPADLIAWIDGAQTTIDLSLDDVMKLRGAGLPVEVIAAMARTPGERLGSLIDALPASASGKTRERSGLSRRQILRMIHEGNPEPDILKAISEQGSKASLSLREALELQGQGVSPKLIAAMETGGPSAPPDSSSAAGAATAPPAQQVPTLDEILPPETSPSPSPSTEPPTLDQALTQEAPPEKGEGPEAIEGEEPAPTIEEALGEEEIAAPEEPGESPTYFFALSDPDGARLMIAPSSARVVDLLKQAKGAGRTPAQIKLAPGSWFLLVEKKPDDFDAELIPAIHTVLDGEGRTRTLIESGDIYYDARSCCLPRSLTGALSIARISEDQQGTILGDEFGGLPPYLWDGNRYLILSVREGKIRRAIKVYEIRRAAGESRTLTATFIPTSVPDPLAPRESPAAESMDEVEARARESWTAPSAAEMKGIGKIYGIPGEEISKIVPALTAAGKAIWRHTGGDGSVTFVAFSLDLGGRLQVEEYLYKKDGPFGMLATPAPPPPPHKRRKASRPSAAEARPLPDLARQLDPESLLPVLTLSNEEKTSVVVRLWDGDLFVVPPGTKREVSVSPGSGEIVVRSAENPEERRKVQAHFTYHARYTLRVD